MEIRISFPPSQSLRSRWHALSRTQNIMKGVYCVYGFHVGCKTAIVLRDAGFDTKYMKDGHSVWKATGGPTRMHV